MKNFFFLSFGFLLFLGAAAQAPAPGWVKKNNFPSGSMEHSVAFLIGDKGYLGLGTDAIGSRKDFWQYDFKTDKWEQMEDFPGDPRSASVAFSIGDKGYVGTGRAGAYGMQEGTNDFWEFNPQKNSWTQKAKFPGGIRYSAVGFSVGPKGYIGLGVNKNISYSDIWEYDPVSNKWTKKTDFPAEGRADASVFTIDMDGYILLGQGKKIIPSNKDCWRFSPVKNEWKRVADFPGPARTGALAFSFMSKGIVMNGFSGTLKRFQDFWEYDSSTDKWYQNKDVPYGTRDYITAFVFNKGAYICTGHGQKNSTGFEVWKYDLPRMFSDKLALGATLLLGENRIPLAAMEVKIYNAKNEFIKTATTGLFGSFLFMDLAHNQEYTIEVNVQDPHWKSQQIYLVNRENELIAIMNSENNFRFKITAEEKNKLQLLRIENRNMRMNLKGKLVLSSETKVPFANAEITLINDVQEVVQVTQTDKSGVFIFNYLPVDTNLYLTIDEKATAALPKGTTILLMDENENIVNKSTPSNSQMLLVSLPPEQNKLGRIFIEDPWLQATFDAPANGIIVMEKVYFEVGKWDLVPEAKAILNKAVIMMKNNNKISIDISAHTDSRGDAKSNLELSDKRAEEAKKYLMSQSIDAKRISARGFGETKLLNSCEEGIDCTEEEHSQNRRMEFKIKTK